MLKIGTKVFKPISVDITTRCPCKCQYCAPHISSCDGVDMDKTTFLCILQILKSDGYNFVYLYGYGEPFMNPCVYDYIGLLRDCKIMSDVASKLSCVINWNLLDKCLPDRMLITIDSLNPEVSKKIAPGINFDLVHKNLDSLITFYEKHHAKLLLVFNTTVCSLNYSEIGDIQAYLAKRIKTFEYSLLHSAKGMGIGFGCSTEEQIAKAIAAARDLWTDQFAEIRFKIENDTIVPLYDGRNWPNGRVCEFTPVINPKGLLTPCCHDAFSSCVIGDVVKEGSVTRLLESEKGKQITEAATKLQLPICRFCN